MTYFGRREALVGSLLFVLGCSSVAQDGDGRGGTGGAGAGTAGSGGTGGVAGGAGTGGGGPGSCSVGGVVYPDGATFQLDCNTCVCSSAGAACTTIACADAGGRGGAGGTA